MLICWRLLVFLSAFVCKDAWYDWHGTDETHGHDGTHDAPTNAAHAHDAPRQSAAELKHSFRKALYRLQACRPCRSPAHRVLGRQPRSLELLQLEAGFGRKRQSGFCAAAGGGAGGQQLTPAGLAAAPPAVQKQIIGERPQMPFMGFLSCGTASCTGCTRKWPNSNLSLPARSRVLGPQGFQQAAHGCVVDF